MKVDSIYRQFVTNPDRSDATPALAITLAIQALASAAAIGPTAVGPVVTAQLTDMGDQPVTIGMPVEMVTRRIRSDGDEKGIIVYGYKFRPVGFNADK